MPSQPTSATALNYVAVFFDAYPSFTYDPTAPSSASEFRRLWSHMRWEKGTPDQKKAWKDFQSALARQFGKVYGTDAENVKAWQRLCSTLKVEPVPRGLKEAREAVLSIYANPVDLIEGFKGSENIQTFENEADLAEYSAKSGKLIFALTPGVGALLRMLLNPRKQVLQGLQLAADSASASLSEKPSHSAGQETPPNPILVFFEMYPSFTYDHTAPSAAAEFRRLCDHKRWEKGNPDQKIAWKNFQNALVRRFNNLFGLDIESLKLWQRVCTALRIEPVPTSLNEAQEAVFNIYFNVVDLIEGYKGGHEMQTFKDDIELAEYSRREGKIISEHNVAAGSLLRALLRRSTDEPLNRPLKPHQRGRNTNNRDRKGKKEGKKALGGRGGGGNGDPPKVAEPEGEQTKKAIGSRNATKKALVQCSVERSGAYVDYDDGDLDFES